MVLKIDDDFETSNLVDPAVSEVVHFFEMMCNFTGFYRFFEFFVFSLSAWLYAVFGTPLAPSRNTSWVLSVVICIISTD